MPVYHAGENVRVLTREQVPADIKSQLYYPHYAGLRGTILKLYGEETSILVHRDSLPPEIRARHVENERAMRQRWLDGLSEEGRNRLNAREKEFGLKYAILVGLKDIEPVAASENEAMSGATSNGLADGAGRTTSGDLTAAEEKFLNEAKKRSGKA